MKVSDLKIVVASLPPDVDDFEVVVWLPGSKIDLTTSFMSPDRPKKTIMVEGNLRPGSALCREF